jgi:hypothetical protein
LFRFIETEGRFSFNRLYASLDMVMATFLRDPKVLDANIIAAQEPWDNPFQDTIHYPAKQSHQLLYPHKADTGIRAQVCCFIHKRIKTTS